MIRFRNIAFCILAVLSSSALLHAQGGCEDSPEAPTDILMLVGVVGMFYGSALVLKLIRRNRTRRGCGSC